MISVEKQLARFGKREIWIFFSLAKSLDGDEQSIMPIPVFFIQIEKLVIGRRTALQFGWLIFQCSISFYKTKSTD